MFVLTKKPVGFSDFWQMGAISDVWAPDCTQVGGRSSNEPNTENQESFPMHRCAVFSPVTPGQALIVQDWSPLPAIVNPTRLVDLTGGFLLEYLPHVVSDEFLRLLSAAASNVSQSRLRFTKRQGKMKQYIFGDWRRYSQEVYSTNCSKTVVGKTCASFFIENFGPKIRGSHYTFVVMGGRFS